MEGKAGIFQKERRLLSLSMPHKVTAMNVDSLVCSKRELVLAMAWDTRKAATGVQ